ARPRARRTLISVRRTVRCRASPCGRSRSLLRWSLMLLCDEPEGLQVVDQAVQDLFDVRDVVPVGVEGRDHQVTVAGRVVTAGGGAGTARRAGECREGRMG